MTAPSDALVIAELKRDNAILVERVHSLSRTVCSLTAQSVRPSVDVVRAVGGSGVLDSILESEGLS